MDCMPDFALLTRAVAAYKLRVSQPGQPAINAATRCCAVYGFPIRHSASPAMHNAAFAKLGLNWRYLAFEVRPDDLRAAIAGAKAMQFSGLNLTVPHKLLAMQIVDELDESAKTWGAVNTVRFEGRDDNGAWLPLHEFGVPPSGGQTQSAKPPEGGTPSEVRSQGFNTDSDGIARSLREDLKLELAGAKVLLLGTGGAGQVAALRLAAENVSELFLVDYILTKAEAVAEEIRKRHPRVKVTIGFPRDAVDLLLNATPIGLKAGDPSPLDEKQFSLRQARAVYDMIYQPAETKLLAAAQAAGCKTANGLGMLLHQGAKAFEIWTGKTAPIDVMRRALEQSIYG
jgi:shikimate dehydrogenase